MDTPEKLSIEELDEIIDKLERIRELKRELKEE